MRVMAQMALQVVGMQFDQPRRQMRAIAILGAGRHLGALGDPGDHPVIHRGALLEGLAALPGGVFTADEILDETHAYLDIKSGIAKPRGLGMETSL